MALPLLLASASPRRRELLEQLGVVFNCEPADIDETPRPGEPAADYVQRMASEKAAAVAARHSAEQVVLAADTSVEVIILTGAGRAFTVGLDLKELGGEQPSEERPSKENLADIMARVPQPVIGAINGFAITGGFELALMCDFIIAADLEWSFGSCAKAVSLYRETLRILQDTGTSEEHHDFVRAREQSQENCR